MAELSQRSVAQMIRTFAKLGCYDETAFSESFALVKLQTLKESCTREILTNGFSNAALPKMSGILTRFSPRYMTAASSIPLR